MDGAPKVVVRGEMRGSFPFIALRVRMTFSEEALGWARAKQILPRCGRMTTKKT
jgi:hypothetical protein